MECSACKNFWKSAFELFSFFRERLEVEAKQTPIKSDDSFESMPMTKKFLFSIMESAELLCNVTIESSRRRLGPERSVSHCSSAVDCGQATQQGV